jgi:hypothetical protein
MTILSTLPMVNARVLEKTGMCSKGSRWTLSLERENSMIDVDFEAENRVLVQQDWNIVIRNNNRIVFQRTVAAGTSFGEDSSDNAQDDEVDNDSVYIFDVSTDIVNRRGKDTIVARATASKTGEVCTGTLVLR